MGTSTECQGTSEVPGHQTNLFRVRRGWIVVENNVAIFHAVAPGKLGTKLSGLGCGLLLTERLSDALSHRVNGADTIYLVIGRTLKIGVEIN